MVAYHFSENLNIDIISKNIEIIMKITRMSIKRNRENKSKVKRINEFEVQ